MPKDRRKDKRKITRIKDLLTMRNFLIIVAILAVIICISSGIMIYRNYQDKQLLAKQKEELDKQIESIFTETLNNISSILFPSILKFYYLFYSISLYHVKIFH